MRISRARERPMRACGPWGHLQASEKAGQAPLRRLGETLLQAGSQAVLAEAGGQPRGPFQAYHGRICRPAPTGDTGATQGRRSGLE